MTTIDISGLDKSTLLIALYNNARVLGLGHAHHSAHKEITPKEAVQILKRNDGRVDELNGKILKVDLNKGKLDPARYNLNNGDGLAARVVANLRKLGSVDRIS